MKRVSRKYVGKCFKNGAEIAPDRLPGTSWHSFWPSWALLGLISGLLGPPGGHFGSPGSHFGPLLALLGLSWRSWGPPGVPKWLQNGSQMAPGRPPGREPEPGDEFLRKLYWHAHGSRVFETWLSWNGKRVRLESCKHAKKGKSSESSKNSKSQSASTRRSSKARAARAARASKQQACSIAGGPCSRAARERRPFGEGIVSRALLRFLSGLSGPSPAKL